MRALRSWLNSSKGLAEKASRARVAHDKVGEPEALVQRSRRRIVVLDFECELATPVLQSTLLGNGEESPTDALSAILGKDRQVVDVEQGTSLKRREPKEADRNANWALIVEREKD